MDRLRPLDSTFISLERDSLPMHIASLMVLDGPAPSQDELLAQVEGRLTNLPRYRQVVREVPLHLGQPVWQDDPNFRLEYHVRRTALASPGDEHALRALCGRLLSSRLDLHKPLWEMWLIEDLPHGRFGILNKVHHAMVDGLSGVGIVESLLDPDPGATPPPSRPWRPHQQPDTLRLLSSSIANDLRAPSSRLAALGRQLARPLDALRPVAAAALGTLRLGERLTHTEEQLIGTPGEHRTWAWAHADLAEVKMIKNGLGGTVNDVILTAIAGGFRAFLEHRGVKLEADAAVRTMVPVSTRPPGDDSGGNEVAAMFADLPVGRSDPLARFRFTRQGLDSVKRSGVLQGTSALVDNAILVPAPILAAAGWLAGHTPQLAVGTITTNVPGPQHPLYLLGRRVRSMIPYVPLGMHQLVTVAIFTYDGMLTCGITGDYDKAPDVGVLATGIEAALAQLADVARSIGAVD